MIVKSKTIQINLEPGSRLSEDDTKVMHDVIRYYSKEGANGVGPCGSVDIKPGTPENEVTELLGFRWEGDRLILDDLTIAALQSAIT